MSFSELIQARIEAGEMLEDTAQAPLVAELSRLSSELESYVVSQPGALIRWMGRSKPVATPPGVYIWGGVGRGKTYLMNAFFELAPTDFKWRIHFHRFMQWVHEQNGQLAGMQDPLKHVAQQVSNKNRLLCLDEFMVTDIADAMILHRLLKHLFEQGVVLVTTSNIEPDSLYYNGIQRESFLPAIELLKQRSVVVEVEGGLDFRKQAWVCEEIYYSPLGQAAQEGLAHCHTQLTGLPNPVPTKLSVAGRTIDAISAVEGVAWFDFHAICQTYRSQKDYIQLSNQFNTLIVSDVPELGAEDDAAARRFINLIDTAYDYGVNLLVSAAKPPDSIYTGLHLERPFKRTASRLWEMSTPAYLKRAKKII